MPSPETIRALGTSRSFRRGTVATSLTIALLLVAAAGLIGQTGATASRLVAKDVIPINVGSSSSSRAIPAGFIGFSIEYPSAPAYFGASPTGLNRTFITLVRHLDPGSSPLIRFGGDTTDWTWWPTPRVTKPPGVRYALTSRWLQVANAMAVALRAHLVFGVNFEADSRAIAAGEARALLTAVGRGRIFGFELGNEPEVYGTLGWYTTRAGRRVPGRPAHYGFRSYLRDYAAISRALPHTVPLVGPASGAPTWLARLGRYLAANPRVRLVTFHRYPLRRCWTSERAPVYATIAHLLAPETASGPALSLQHALGVAHAHGVDFRVDELNSASCGGVRGVSDTFASALWVLDTLFHMVRVGVDGVNIHTFRHAVYAPFEFTHAHGRWLAQVKPLYYGLLMFTRAAPAGSRLLSTARVATPLLRTWATRDLAGTVRVVLINESPRRSLTVSVRSPAPSESATVQRLSATGLGATSGVTIGGQTFGSETVTAQLTGSIENTVVTATDRRFVLTLPPASAVMLSVPATGR